MLFAGLSLDQAPPYGVTMKFFISGLVYALLGGVYLALGGGLQDAIFIHLMTLGFMMMVMIGAIFQFLPVVGGVTFKRVKLLSNLIFFGLHLGLLGFVFGLYHFNPFLLQLSSKVLFLTVLLASLSVIYKVIVTKTKNFSILAIALALLFLFFGMLAGVWMMHAFATHNITQTYILIKDLHLHTLFFGWVLMLVMGVSFQVVPMFWVAKDFSTKTKAVSILLLVLALLGYGIFLNPLFSKLLALFGAIYAVMILHRLYMRKRKLRDYSVYYWYISMASLLVSMVMFAFGLDSLLLYKILAFGFIYGVICAMLYKIIPFITWFHLSAKGLFDIPTMKEMIKQRSIAFGFYLFALSYIALIFSSIHPVFDGLFIYGFIGLNLLHLLNFLNVIRVYKKHL